MVKSSASSQIFPSNHHHPHQKDPKSSSSTSHTVMVASSLTSSNVTDSRSRFAEAWSNAHEQQQSDQGQTSDVAQQEYTSNESETLTPYSRPSPHPNEAPLSGQALKKLGGLLGMVSKGAASTATLTPIKLLRKVEAMETLMSHVRGGVLPAGELDLGSAFHELENAPMESLSPELQKLKLGWDQDPLLPGSFRDAERRINQLLRANGEMHKLHVVFSGWRNDTSTDPPTRVRNTQRESDEEAMLQGEQLDDLRARKPELYEKVVNIMAELIPPGAVSQPRPKRQIKKQVSRVRVLFPFDDADCDPSQI